MPLGHPASEPPSYVWGAPPSGQSWSPSGEVAMTGLLTPPLLQLQGRPGTNKAARQRHLVQA